MYSKLPLAGRICDSIVSLDMRISNLTPIPRHMIRYEYLKSNTYEHKVEPVSSLSSHVLAALLNTYTALMVFMFVPFLHTHVFTFNARVSCILCIERYNNILFSDYYYYSLFIIISDSKNVINKYVSTNSMLK